MVRVCLRRPMYVRRPTYVHVRACVCVLCVSYVRVVCGVCVCVCVRASVRACACISVFISACACRAYVCVDASMCACVGSVPVYVRRNVHRSLIIM